eukprot:EG_transcript_4074
MSKPSSQADRGLLGCLPIPPLCNDIIFLDFVALDEFNSFDYALGIVDGLSRFCLYLPCHKEVTGEKVLKMILKEWVEKFGRPNEVLSDNDIRFKSSSGFYQEAMKSLGIKVSFSLPRHPSSNGLMERENRSFVQTLRCLVHETGTKDWPKLLPYVNFVMNSQISSSTGMSPSELFLGRSPWKFESVGEPCESPSVENWILEQLLLQEKASLRLKHLRSLAMERKNKVRKPAVYEIGQFVLVHKSRWPQRKVEKIASPWFGPYKVVQVHYNSLQILASPSLGGLVKVSFSQVKHWSSVHDPHNDTSFLSEECEEIDGAQPPASLTGHTDDRGTGGEQRGASDAHRGARDERTTKPEHDRTRPEQETQGERPRTAERARDARPSARDEPPERPEGPRPPKDQFPQSFPSQMVTRSKARGPESSFKSKKSIFEVGQPRGESKRIWRKKSEFEKDNLEESGPDGPLQQAAAVAAEELADDVQNVDDAVQLPQAELQHEGVLAPVGPILQPSAADSVSVFPVSQPEPEKVSSFASECVSDLPKTARQFSEMEAAKMGFYNVEAILDHKFRNGWRFLTKWENYPVPSSTWEPVRSFILPGGRMNTVFQNYIQDNGLQEVLKKAQKNVNTQPSPVFTVKLFP